MLFSSPIFLYFFLPITLAIYYILRLFSSKLKNIFLLVSSLFFYAWGEPTFVFVMICSIFINYSLGMLLKLIREEKIKIKDNTVIYLTILINTSILFVYKYLTFFIKNINLLLNINLCVPTIALPIGISFFTFQAMSYVFDIYMGKGEIQTNILNVGLYISFFPQLIAGPIVRYETINDEIENRKETLEDFSNGFIRLVIGLSKKVLLANTFALIADTAFNSISVDKIISVSMAWLGAFSYAFQIFFDFCGYSDMAIGLGLMFGFHFLENFNYPYISSSITEFWRRWHISLGSWFRDYVYFPLGGSRVSNRKIMRNLFIVWLLTGVWHGANWTYIIWGLMYFFLISIEKMYGIAKKEKTIAGRIFGWLYTIFFVLIGWVIFRSDSILVAIKYIGSMFGIGTNVFVDGLFRTEIKSIRYHLIFGILFSTPIAHFIKNKISHNLLFEFIHVTVLLFLFILSLSCILSSSYNPFIYFNF